MSWNCMRRLVWQTLAAELVKAGDMIHMILQMRGGARR